MRTAPAPARIALFAAAGALLGGALFSGGGSGDGSLVWIGGGAALAAAIGAALALLRLGLPLPRLGREGMLLFACLAALVGWIGLGIAWSIEPDRSWSYLNRGLVYLSFAVVGALAAAAAPRAFRAVGLAVSALLFAVLAWALLGKILPALGPADVGRWIARLRSPVGYWNGLALLADTALPLGLWLAAERGRSRALRAAGALLVYAAVLACLLTYSRAGIAIGVLAALAWLLLARERFEGIVALLVAGGGGLAVFGIAFALPGVTKDGVTHAARVHDGALFAIPLLLGAALVPSWGLARAQERRDVPAGARRLVVRDAASLAALAAVAALVALIVHAGGPGQFFHDRWREFANPASAQVSQTAGRLDTLSSNNRWTWWTEAWHVFTNDPLSGKGPGTFDLSHRLLRRNELDALEPHNLAVQLLGETGIVGFLLGLGAALAGLSVAARAVRRAGEDRTAAVALGLAVPIWLVHALVDFNFDFLAVTAPMFLVVGALAAAGRPAAEPEAETAAVRRRSPLGAAAAILACLAALYALGAPWLGARAADASLAAIGDGDYAAAISHARDAHRLNPLSLDPLYDQALAESLLAATSPTRRVRDAHLQAAFDLYQERIRMQPENWEPWFSMGEFLRLSAHDPCDAYDYYNRAYTLDRFGDPGTPGGGLDITRAVRNAGHCPARRPG